MTSTYRMPPLLHERERKEQSERHSESMKKDGEEREIEKLRIRSRTNEKQRKQDVGGGRDRHEGQHVDDRSGGGTAL